jgi:hypothetical protein
VLQYDVLKWPCDHLFKCLPVSSRNSSIALSLRSSYATSSIWLLDHCR